MKILSEVGLNFEKQMHVKKHKYTYKQNTTTETTVAGDCLFFFRKESISKLPEIKPYKESAVKEIINKFINKYIGKHGPSQISEMCDNGLIKKLYYKGYLKYFNTSTKIVHMIKEKYELKDTDRKVYEKQ